MAVPSLEPQRESQTDRYPLLMERSTSHSGEEHVIDVTTRGSVASSSGSHVDNLSDLETPRHDGGPSSTTQLPISQSSSSSSITSTSRNASLLRRGDGYGRRRHRSPLNSGLWISIELIITVSQIIASVVVLSLSRHENPQAPLFAWVVGYASGCVATLPLLYWRYIHRNLQGSAEQESTHARQGSSQGNASSESTSYTAISVPQAPEEEPRRTARSWFTRSAGTAASIPRLNALVDHFKMALDCFFAVWFVVGNVWIFGGHTSAGDAPNLYRLCIVFLTFSCIGYAMPFILCATICCCLPCIISVLGFREDLGQTRGATPESIGALPTYKFKLKKNRSRGENEISSEGGSEGGIFAAGTNRERVISAEDAVCCICLAKYADNDELRELPCSHFFHMQCVDEWLKINASCPLCKAEVGESIASLSSPNSSWLTGERRVGNGSTSDAYRSSML
ncbi:E3 ubiquitin-protein ligase At1g63170 [Magnolia sinica]|uniref:E3 ubiquitin-protein ligase At1g63170 n=1 Tax=Magnolia sinica TaxID=86752 RepID=UPI002659BE3A|nr:E3 ubiquitin-protein ligase At1g63170 [Magnolia sinica]XP_058074682.1 E3 ubiquitin-protein ligase At1g63170 [Magnolia sinica]XP_058074683.1 E3 ubiquitin-protein ligase At1g63170 [Magnolia sinica]XP_058074684.1 E3 ubiquitin-protein ligase At1g63170 [Magnolia sinica]XP_058074685.1 E3 ubiquitin-protein ligase At1g63170 [Magnolia sinica]XP_058074686.1 E3 ubiquitin-protein ligase At1g63170 [Magnolia sinica]XP_058074687.1 E3 ubiquitin-protein ligase At1g63170 [Magnolia sinica]XP_058074688.1 E3 